MSQNNDSSCCSAPGAFVIPDNVVKEINSRKKQIIDFLFLDLSVCNR